MMLSPIQWSVQGISAFCLPKHVLCSELRGKVDVVIDTSLLDRIPAMIKDLRG